MSLQESQLWQDLVSTDAPTLGPDMDALATSVGPAELDDLIRVLEQGSDRERLLAVTLAVALRFELRDNHKRFALLQKGNLSRALLNIAQSQYPHSPLGARAVLTLIFLDKKAAGKFLTSIRPSQQLGRIAVDTFLHDVRYALDKWQESFKEFSKAGGYLAERAANHLESAGHISEEELIRLGQHFRQNKDAKSLNRINAAFISHQVNKPIEPIISLLGEPDQRRESAYIYNAEGIQLYMEHDKDGKLTGIKIK